MRPSAGAAPQGNAPGEAAVRRYKLVQISPNSMQFLVFDTATGAAWVLDGSPNQSSVRWIPQGNPPGAGK